MRSAKPAAEVKPIRIRQNSEIDPIPLTCGCDIPYPVIGLLGSRPKKIWCELHDGWYAIKKERKKKCQSTPNKNQTTLDLPPY